MKLTNLLALPPTIVILLCTSPATAEPRWPSNIPRHMKYFPEDEVHVKRSLDIQEKMRRERPIGVRKMSSDEGEMFMFDNWIFASDLQDGGKERRSGDEHGELANTTAQFQAALRPIDESALYDSNLLRYRVRDALMKRSFKCPSGTNDCSSIGQPNSCCGTGSSCIEITDTGYGPVGCCPNGETCGGRISCDTDAGYTSCPESPNGGCCLPGYSCLDVGCVAIGTSVTYVRPSTSTSESRATSSTGVIVVPTTQSSASSPAPTSTPSTSYTCSTGWFSCPASLGGGCCQNGRTCATGASCLGDEPSSTLAPSAPVRPTSDSGTTSAPPASSSPTNSVCPVGFYVCSAYYPLGCCRVGRDCQTTGSCVAISSTTVINTNGVVVVAPSGASVATGSCPSAWYSCAASLGGNCCPNGFSCGEHCTATSGTNVAEKVAPSTAATIPSMISISVMLISAFGIGTAMIIL